MSDLLYADYLVILGKIFEGLMTNMVVCKNCLEPKGLEVNMRKTKVIISGRDLHTLQTSDKYLCAICRKGIRKWVFCSGCSFCVHKKCPDIPGRLIEVPNFRCRRCAGNAQAIDGRPCVGKPSSTCSWLAWCSRQFCISWWLYLSRWSL